MNKQSLRYLSLGFFFSALLLGGYQVIEKPDAANHPVISAEELEKADTSSELDVVSEEEGSFEEDSYIEETDSADDEKQTEEELEEQEEPEDSEETETEEEVASPVVIVVADGQPSSVVAGQLKEQGIIEDSFEFDKYLEENGYARKIRPGRYEVTKGMTFQEIVDVLLNR